MKIIQDNARDLAAWMTAERTLSRWQRSYLWRETSVKVTGTWGRGGRNARICACDALRNHPRLVALSGDTDGIDGADDVRPRLLHR